MVNFLMLGKICLYWCKFEMFTFIHSNNVFNTLRRLGTNNIIEDHRMDFHFASVKIYTLELLPWILRNHYRQFLHGGPALSQGYPKRRSPYRSFIILPELCSLNSDKNVNYHF